MEITRIKAAHSFPIWLPQTQTWMYNQVKFLPGDVECHIICERTENLDQFNLPNIHSLHKAPKWRSVMDRGLRKLNIRQHVGFMTQQLQKNNIHLLHSHFGNVGWMNIGAAEQAGVRHVVTFYGRDVIHLPRSDPAWHGRYQKLFAQVDRVLCEGPHMADCIAGLGCPRETITVHHLGVEVDKIPFRPRVWDASQPLRVLIAASFREKKGVPLAIEALGALRERVPVEVTIIGDADDSAHGAAEKQKILRAIGEHLPRCNVRMLGYKPHAVFLDEAAVHHVFLSPSLSASDGDTEGGAPVSIIEAAASGMAIVSTTHCDIPGVVRHGDTGLLAEERDVGGLVKHLMWFAGNPSAWAKMLEAGRRHIESEFNVAVQGDRLASHYRAACSPRRTP
ncbi:MAG: glycosyltransferase [Candidatus Latescibacterota bacterium]